MMQQPLSQEQKSFLTQVRAAMIDYFADDRRRIEHALKVAEYAVEMLDYIEADPLVTMLAAYLHDIGIHEAERKHGSNAGHLQEIEGPPIARGILEELGLDPERTERVAELVARHHTPRGVDSPEFRILWDADALVNYAEILPSRPEDEVAALLHRHMVTEVGYRMAQQLFLRK